MLSELHLILSEIWNLIEQSELQLSLFHKYDNNWLKRYDSDALYGSLLLYQLLNYTSITILCLLLKVIRTEKIKCT